jgi:hypothetical protein
MVSSKTLWRVACIEAVEGEKVDQITFQLLANAKTYRITAEMPTGWEASELANVLEAVQKFWMIQVNGVDETINDPLFDTGDQRAN